MSRIKGKDGNNWRSVANGPCLSRPDLQEDTCVLLVSVQGNTHCTDNENPFFSSTLIELKEKFKKVIVLVVDEPQAHNLKVQHPEATPEELKTMAEELGDQWWKDHESSFWMSTFQENNPDQPLMIGEQKIKYKKQEISKTVIAFSENHEEKKQNYASVSRIQGDTVDDRIQYFNKLARDQGIEVIRWRDWVQQIPNEDIEEAKRICEDKNSELYHAIVKSAQEFAKRQKGKKSPEFYQASIDFLSEEAPLLALGCKAFNAVCMAYAGDKIEAFEAARQHFIHDEDYMNWVQFVFHRVEEKDVIRKQNIQHNEPSIEIILPEDEKDSKNQKALDDIKIICDTQTETILSQEDKSIHRNILDKKTYLHRNGKSNSLSFFPVVIDKNQDVFVLPIDKEVDVYRVQQDFLNNFDYLRSILPKQDITRMLNLLQDSIDGEKETPIIIGKSSINAGI